MDFKNRIMRRQTVEAVKQEVRLDALLDWMQKKDDGFYSQEERDVAKEDVDYTWEGKDKQLRREIDFMERVGLASWQHARSYGELAQLRKQHG